MFRLQLLLSDSSQGISNSTKPRIILRRNELECGSTAVAFPEDSHDSIFSEAQ